MPSSAPQRPSRRRPSLVGLLALLPAAALAQPIPIGDAFAVNTTTESNQQQPDVGMSDAGGFLIAWKSFGQDGDGDGIYARKFQPDGTPFTEFRLSQATVNDQSNPALDMNASGNFVGAWQSVDQAGVGTGRDVYARRSSGGGTILFPESLVNTTTAGFTSDTAASRSDDGSYVFAWRLGTAVFFRRFDASGGAINGEVEVRAGTSSTVDVAAAPDGSFVVVYVVSSGGISRIEARLYGADATPIGEAFSVGEADEGNVQAPVAGMAADGSFVVAWLELDTVDTIRARRFAAGGTPLGGEIIVSTSGLPGGPDVAVAAAGAFVVVWSSVEADGNCILAREFHATGAAVDAAYPVSPTTSTPQLAPAVAMGDDRFVVVWDAPDGSAEGIFGRRLYHRAVFVFGDGFESGDTTAWSSSVP